MELDWKFTIVVYPSAGSVFYKDLGRRLARACEEISLPVTSCSSAELRDMDNTSLQDATLLIVNPWECAHELVDKPKFYERLAGARKRVMVLAEAVEFRWFDAQFDLPITYDALIDVGFASQENKLDHSSLPYIFLFHGPTLEEEKALFRMSALKRPIPWAFVGHRRDDRIEVAAELIDKVDPGGLVFMPDPGQGVRQGKGMIGPSGMASSLARTQYYVWRSLHTFRYYESFRFREAILAGAAPCKIDPEVPWDDHDIPGIFSSVEDFAQADENKGFESIQGAARDFYLSGGRLANHLKGVLASV